MIFKVLGILYYCSVAMVTLMSSEFNIFAVIYLSFEILGEWFFVVFAYVGFDG